MTNRPEISLQAIAALPATESCSPVDGKAFARDRSLQRAEARSALGGAAVEASAEIAPTADGTLLRTGERAQDRVDMNAIFITTRGAAELAAKRKKGTGQP